MVTQIFILLIVFQIKHLLADYFLQGEYHLGKFLAKGWVRPLASHCCTHAVFTYGVAVVFLLCCGPGGTWFVWYGVPVAAGLAALDFVLHFVMDRFKAAPHLLGRYKILSGQEYREQRLLTGLTVWTHDAALRTARSRLRGNTYAWWALGADQLWHHMTHYLIIALLLAAVAL